MKRFLKAVILALAVFVPALMFAGPAASAPPVSATHQAVEAQPAAGAAFLAAANTTPTDSASATNPANAGTGETAEAEGTRMDYTPWVIGAVVLIVLAVILFLRRRRNKSAHSGA